MPRTMTNSTFPSFGARARALTAIALVALPLSACGAGRDEAISEKLAAAEAAAQRATRAADRAEAAAKKLGVSVPAPIEEVEPTANDEENEEERADQDPGSDKFDNTIVDSQPQQNPPA